MYINFMYTVVLLFILFFFFSSRRRHTRYIGDWSSDVCSSDLFRRKTQVGNIGLRFLRKHRRQRRWPANQLYFPWLGTPATYHRYLHRCAWIAGQQDLRLPERRSEERRVGKECRAWRTRASYDKEYEERRCGTPAG